MVLGVGVGREGRVKKGSFFPSFLIDWMDYSSNKYFFGLLPTSSIDTLALQPHLRVPLFAFLINATGLFTKS